MSDEAKKAAEEAAAAAAAEAKAAEEAKAEADAKAKALAAEQANLVNVVATSRGQFSPTTGLCQVGDAGIVAVEAFSSEWMRPKTIGDRNKLMKAGKLPKA